MGYTKKKFDGKYLSWYNTIVANKGNNPQISEYSPTQNTVSSLDWQGEGKQAICNSVKTIDESCQSIHQGISNNIDKVKICNGPLFNELTNLKSKCDEYNSYVDQYDAAIKELERRKNIEVS